MRFRCFNRILVQLILLTVFASQSSALTVAIAPLEDLTQTRSGVDLDLTHHLSETLEHSGFTTVSQQQIINFMITNAIRRCGELDSLTARRMAKELSCDIILLGTITEKDSSRNPKIALTLTVIDGSSGELCWGTTVSGHINDSQPLLGIGRLTSSEEIQQHSFDGFAESFAKQLQDFTALETILPDYRITDVQLKPELVRGGAPLSCRVKIEFLDQAPEYLKVETTAGSTILKRSQTQHYYEGQIATDPSDGDHSIHLHLHWNDRPSKQINDFATYRVANTPPDLRMYVTTGLNIDNTFAFSDSVVVIPQLEEPRPVDHWKLAIKDQNGFTILTEEQHSDLPERLEWRGTDSHNRRLDTGRYTMTMQVWDIAGNQNQITTKLYLQPTSQEMINISQIFIDGENYLQLLPAENQIVPIEHWSLTLETDEGAPVFSKTGWELPTIVALPQDITIDSLICNVTALDKLGNNSLLSAAPIQVPPSHGKVAQRTPKNEWTADF